MFFSTFDSRAVPLETHRGPGHPSDGGTTTVGGRNARTASSAAGRLQAPRTACSAAGMTRASSREGRGPAIFQRCFWRRNPGGRAESRQGCFFSRRAADEGFSSTKSGCLLPGLCLSIADGLYERRVFSAFPYTGSRQNFDRADGFRAGEASENRLSSARGVFRRGASAERGAEQGRALQAALIEAGFDGFRLPR